MTYLVLIAAYMKRISKIPEKSFKAEGVKIRDKSIFLSKNLFKTFVHNHFYREVLRTVSTFYTVEEMTQIGIHKDRIQTLLDVFVDTLEEAIKSLPTYYQTTDYRDLLEFIKAQKDVYFIEFKRL